MLVASASRVAFVESDERGGCFVQFSIRAHVAVSLRDEGRSELEIANENYGSHGFRERYASPYPWETRSIEPALSVSNPMRPLKMPAS